MKEIVIKEYELKDIVYYNNIQGAIVDVTKTEKGKMYIVILNNKSQNWVQVYADKLSDTYKDE